MTIRNLAGAEFQGEVLRIIHKYNLTFGETFNMLSRSMLRWANYLKEDEDNEKKMKREREKIN